MKNYISIKERIFANQGKNDALVLNYDDEICRSMANRTESRIAYFSAIGEPQLEDSDIMPAPCVFLSAGSVYYRYGAYYERLWDIGAMRTPFKHILEDAMAAALIAIIAGAPFDVVSETVVNFSGVAHRVEYVTRINEVEYYNDSKATNVDSALKALQAIDGNVIVIGGGQDKRADFSAWVKLFPEKAKSVIVFGETAKHIISECEKIGYKNWKRVSSLKEAVISAKNAAEPGDRVLFSPACASLDMFRDYEERGELFKEYVRKDLNME